MAKHSWKWMHNFVSPVLVSQLRYINRHSTLITIKETPAEVHKNFCIFTSFSLRKRTIHVGRDLRRSSTPASCLKQGQACLGFCPVDFKILREIPQPLWEIWSSAWQLSEWEKFSPCHVGPSCVLPYDHCHLYLL